METWKIILMVLVSIAGTGGSCGWILKRYIDQELKRKHDIEIENLRNALGISSIEHQVRFQSLHEKQARILAKTYSLLHDLRKAIERSRHLRSDEIDPRPVYDCYLDFVKYFEPRRLFFPSQTANLAKQLFDKYIDLYAGYSATKNPSTPSQFKIEKRVLETHVDIMSLSEQLETDFKKLLGVA